VPTTLVYFPLHSNPVALNPIDAGNTIPLFSLRPPSTLYNGGGCPALCLGMGQVVQRSTRSSAPDNPSLCGFRFRSSDEPTPKNRRQQSAYAAVGKANWYRDGEVPAGFWILQRLVRLL
jgi:hypothetical protein